MFSSRVECGVDLSLTDIVTYSSPAYVIIGTLVALEELLATFMA